MRYWLDRTTFRVVLAVVAILILCVAVSWIPGGRSRVDQERRTMIECQENLSRIDGAKERWALEHNRTIGDGPPTIQDLAPSDGSGYMKKFPVCPKGGRYTIGVIGSDPTCDSGLPGHSLSEVGDAAEDLGT